MLADFDDAFGKIGLQLNLTKTMLMRNGWLPDAPFSLNGTIISIRSICVSLSRESINKQDRNGVSVIERSIERMMLGVTRLAQLRVGIRSSTLRQQPKIRDAAAYAKLSKIRWAGHVMRLNDNRWTKAVSN
ncbi:hypothetical protein Y032_0007g3492 [Ancylostoma ceylanicum]|uniref:Reverse transcriptase domain-containing protein n=1 Tax=Ancylostoma ceylanicum TaxID=53326 RepID=A0A016VQ63_9BILA|nr:hypothetical protein Y032_0007g3492 [Ancylostoma ceylanicum]